MSDVPPEDQRTFAGVFPVARSLGMCVPSSVTGPFADILQVSLARVRRELITCEFRIAEAVWYQSGMLRLYFGSSKLVTPWALAAMPRLWFLDGERVEARYEDVFPCLASKAVTAFAEYKTSVHPSAPMLLRETSTGYNPNIIALVAQ